MSASHTSSLASLLDGSGPHEPPPVRNLGDPRTEDQGHTDAGQKPVTTSASHTASTLHGHASALDRKPGFGSATSPVKDPPITSSFGSGYSQQHGQRSWPHDGENSLRSIASGTIAARPSSSSSSSRLAQYPSSLEVGSSRNVGPSSHVSPGPNHASDGLDSLPNSHHRNNLPPCTCGYDNHGARSPTTLQQQPDHGRQMAFAEPVQRLPLPHWGPAPAAASFGRRDVGTTSSGIHPSFYASQSRSPKGLNYDSRSITSSSKRSMRDGECSPGKGKESLLASCERAHKYVKLDEYGQSSSNPSPSHASLGSTPAPSTQLRAMHLGEDMQLAPEAGRVTPQLDRVMETSRHDSKESGKEHAPPSPAVEERTDTPSGLSALLPLQDMTPGERDHHEAALRLASLAAASKGAQQDAGTFAAAAAALYRYPNLQAPPMPSRGLSTSAQTGRADKTTSTWEDARHPNFALALPEGIKSRWPRSPRQSATGAWSQPADAPQNAHAQALHHRRPERLLANSHNQHSTLPTQIHRSSILNPLRAHGSTPSLVSGESNSQYDRATLSDAVSTASSTSVNLTPENNAYLPDPSILMSGANVITAAEAAVNLSKHKSGINSAATSQTGGSLGTIGERSELSNGSGSVSTAGQGQRDAGNGSGKYVSSCCSTHLRYDTELSFHCLGMRDLPSTFRKAIRSDRAFPHAHGSKAILVLHLRSQFLCQLQPAAASANPYPLRSRSCRRGMSIRHNTTSIRPFLFRTALRYSSMQFREAYKTSHRLVASRYHRSLQYLLCSSIQANNDMCCRNHDGMKREMLCTIQGHKISIC